MEIPYNVTTRPDTGLYNSKLGVWLFLASEVMLFGALFSSYILLRAYAPDESWYFGNVQNMWLGCLNTAVLILSSFTMVMAWAEMKLRNWKMSQIYLGITIFCALFFLGVKYFEYKAKFEHFGMFIKLEAWPKYAAEVVNNEGRYLEHPTAKRAVEVTGKLKKETDEYVVIKVEKYRPRPNELFEYNASHPVQAALPANAHGGSGGSGKGDYVAELKVPREDIVRMGYWTPSYNAYFAIYYTMTGLHALHIIGGIVVLGYFFLFGHLIYRHNPEHQANRLEVCGLFWHFVDLVWIFLFPILYLL